ncbi:MAG: His/Gly/Thr/Pro-type tRNA ligase C-terminal domain-containing protein, partial [Candidatus Omnitrophica bacterium]|nr:His/Gly/Thr/Pro-type tRNA ligase C-terminal domain-containing protein [Candidatus Omnitrophota bacterium]
EKAGIRFEVDQRNETLNKKIRQAELNKIPYVLVVGQREAEQGTVSVRKRGTGDLGAKTIAEFINQIKEEIENKVL